MKWFTITICIINFIMALCSIPFCLMGGVASMDSPQAQNSVISHVVSFTFLTFPIVCLVCSILPRYLYEPLTTIVLIFPYFEVLVFFTLFYFFGSEG